MIENYLIGASMGFLLVYACAEVVLNGAIRGIDRAFKTPESAWIWIPPRCLFITCEDEKK